MRAQNKSSYERNREIRIAKQKEYYKANKESVNNYKTRRYNSDPNYKLTVSLRNRIYKAVAYQCGEKSARTVDLLGCSVKELRMWLESQFQQGMSWDNYGSKWHIDHYFPCASFDLTKAKEQGLCFHWTNLQPLWATENLRKNATDPMPSDFIARNLM